MLTLEGLIGPHVRNLGRALDRTSQRHGVLANNLANVNVPGYKRREVDFAVELESAASGDRFERLQSRLAQQLDRASGHVRIDGNSVDMERETVALGESEMRYEALTEMTARFFGGLKTVIREGR